MTAVTSGCPTVSVPVLSRMRVVHLARRERAAAFDHHAAPGRRRQSGDQGDRRRQDQRTRCRHHEDGDGLHRAPQGPCDGGDRKRQGQEPHGVPVGEADERRL